MNQNYPVISNKIVIKVDQYYHHQLHSPTTDGYYLIEIETIQTRKSRDDILVYVLDQQNFNIFESNKRAIKAGANQQLLEKANPLALSKSYWNTLYFKPSQQNQYYYFVLDNSHSVNTDKTVNLKISWNSADEKRSIGNPDFDEEFFAQFGNGGLYPFLLIQVDLKNHSSWFDKNEVQKNQSKKELAKSVTGMLKDCGFYRLFWAGDGGIFVKKAMGMENYDIVVDAADAIYDLFGKWQESHKNLDTQHLGIRVCAMYDPQIFADKEPGFWASKDLNQFIKYERTISENGFAITENIKDKLTTQKQNRFDYLRVIGIKYGKKMRVFYVSNHNSIKK